VNFHTHGAGGSVALGAGYLNLDTYIRLENQDFGRLFAKDCIITFDGCNVAEGCAGEYFLVEIARTLLLDQGGKVRGNTGAGFGSWFGGDSVHPFGSWVTANLGPGGTLRLENGIHLHRDNIQKRIEKLRANIPDFESKGLFHPGDKEAMDKALLNAVGWAANDNWDNRFQACKWLDTAESKLSALYAASGPRR
jgi:hypothetical protein